MGTAQGDDGMTVECPKCHTKSEATTCKDRCKHCGAALIDCG